MLRLKAPAEERELFVLGLAPKEGVSAFPCEVRAAQKLSSGFGTLLPCATSTAM